MTGAEVRVTRLLTLKVQEEAVSRRMPAGSGSWKRQKACREEQSRARAAWAPFQTPRNPRRTDSCCFRPRCLE